MKCTQCDIELPAIAGACWKCGAPMEGVLPEHRKLSGSTSGGGGSAPIVVEVTPAQAVSAYTQVLTARDEPLVGRVLPSNRDRFADRVGASSGSPSHTIAVASVGSAYGRATRVLGRSFGVLIVAGFLALALELAISWTVERVLGIAGQSEDSPVRTFATLVTQVLVAAPLSAGWQFLCLRAVREHPISVADVFAPYRGRLFDTAMASLVQALLVVLSCIPIVAGYVALALSGVVAGSAGTADIADSLTRLSTGVLLTIIVGTIAGMIPPIIVATRLSLMPYVIVDEAEGPLVAAQESWARSRGLAPTIFGITVAGSVIVVVGVFAFLVGVIPAAMLVSLAHAALYDYATDRAERQHVATRSVDVLT